MNCSGCSTKLNEYASDNLFTWCTNCGNYGINMATRRALVELDVRPQDALLVFDIGCNGNGSDKIGGYRFHGLHGRAIPFAVGAALGNPDLKILASGGDGATLSEGINHLIHCVRHDYNIVFLLHNNGNYGLTTGQASATTPAGIPMNSAPNGVNIPPINVIDLLLSLNPTFLARTFSGNIDQMTHIIMEGIKHRGFSFIEILQHCPTYNKATPHEWYQQRVYDTISLPDYNNQDLSQAREVSQDLQDKIATGILYHSPR